MITDCLGRFFRPMPGARIVSLVPSLTETLFALGLVHEVAGVTSYCTFPETAVDGLPKLGGTKTPRIDAIRALAPGVVHMNQEENLAPHAERIREFAPVFVTNPVTLDDVDELFATLGILHDRQKQADSLRSGLAAARSAVAASAHSFRFAVPIWKNPWMWAGGDTYISQLIASTGGVNVLASSRRYPSLSIDEVMELSPDVIFLPDEPWKFDEDDARMLRGKDVEVHGPFPGHLVTWHGVRTIEGLEFLSRTLSKR